MNRKEYSRHELAISNWLLNYCCQNDIDVEWMNRLLLDVLQGYVVRFEDDD